jgi:hypothetical protein
MEIVNYSSFRYSLIMHMNLDGGKIELNISDAHNETK